MWWRLFLAMTVGYDNDYDDDYDNDNDYDNDYGYDDGENTLCKRPSITPNQKRRHNMTFLQTLLKFPSFIFFILSLFPSPLGEMEGAMEEQFVKKLPLATEMINFADV